MTDDKNTPDPFDPAQFRAPNTLDGGGDGIRKEFIHIRVGKPKNTVFLGPIPIPLTGRPFTSSKMIKVCLRTITSW